MSKFLVTGGAGFIGSNLVDAILEQGDEVRIVDDLSSGYVENLESSRSRIDFVEGSITDPEVVSRVMEDVDYVLHHAALASVPKSVDDPILNHRINVDGTLHLLLAARDAGVKRFVLASSSAVYGESEASPKTESLPATPISPYGTSKLIGEDYCRQFTASGWLDTVCLRYFNIFGPRQDPGSDYAAVIPIFINRLLDGKEAIIYGDGKQTRDFVYIENVIRANLLAVKSEAAVGGVFNIGCGKSYTVADLHAKIAAILGTDAEPVYAPARSGDVKDSAASIDRAREGLGFEPAVECEAGLERTVAWFRDNRVAPGRTG